MVHFRSGLEYTPMVCKVLGLHRVVAFHLEVGGTRNDNSFQVALQVDLDD